jgi:hypothetical protein
MGQLIRALRSRCPIGPDAVYLNTQAQGVAAIGRHFPVAAFRQSLPR